MSGPIMQPLTLSTICGGAAEEVFAREMSEVLKNITDPNTTAEAKRKITLSFEFEPMSDRSGAEVRFACSSRLASVALVKSSIFLSRQGGEIHAYPSDTRQQPLFDHEKEEAGSTRQPDKVVSIKKQP